MWEAGASQSRLPRQERKRREEGREKKWTSKELQLHFWALYAMMDKEEQDKFEEDFA